MFQLFSLSLAILPVFCSASVARNRNDESHVDPQERALSMLANPSSLDLISVSGMVPATVQVETPSGNNLMVMCNSTLYGAGLNARSCFDSLAQGPTGNDQESWGFSKPGRHVDHTLPIVVMGGDVTCGIIPKLRLSTPAIEIAHASAKNVSDAARAVIQECVIRRRIGGLGFQIGGDDNLAVAVGTLANLNATCTDTVTTPQSSCWYIMDGMYKTHGQERFGHARLRGLTVALPLTLRAPDGKCQVVIDTQGPDVAVSATWANVWLAVEATVALCVRNGKGGTLKVPEQSSPGIVQPDRGLFVTIMDEQNP
ncbi:hypothetical protein BDR22DRAFT_877166 [Usnea florida]